MLRISIRCILLHSQESYRTEKDYVIHLLRWAHSLEVCVTKEVRWTMLRVQWNSADNNAMARSNSIASAHDDNRIRLKEGLEPMWKCSANVQAVPTQDIFVEHLRTQDLFVEHSFERRGNKDFIDNIIVFLTCKLYGYGRRREQYSHE